MTLPRWIDDRLCVDMPSVFCSVRSKPENHNEEHVSVGHFKMAMP